MKDEKSCGTNSAAQVEGKKPYSEKNKTAEQHANAATAKAVQPFKRSKLVTAVAVVVSIVVALCAFLMVWYLGDDYPDFKRFRQSFAIPGLEEGLIPQEASSGIGNRQGLQSAVDGVELLVRVLIIGQINNVGNLV